MAPRRRDRKLVNQELTCKPLKNYNEILLFLENPPPWRTLCKPLTPHSDRLIRNVEINRHVAYQSKQTTEAFCHFDESMPEIRRYEAKGLRKTLVCHDLMNGYHDDSVIDGTGNFDAYLFYNWAGIDIFCYFSHHLITIPPVGWINTAHAHGVKVIGTIITEWADGISFWDQILVSETEYQNLANALVAIAKTLKFDGWLLNVENKISQPEMLLEFVSYFHKLLHSELEHATLIWYDSVTVQGNLSWQNKLNDKNKAFFDVTDGFFTNYSWSVDDIVTSVEVAEERVTDLYIGIDVWGRNFYAGGQFNTAEAIKVAHHAGCSLAIFAPGWTHEALSTDKNDPNSVLQAGNLEVYEQFLLRDRAFWSTVWPFLNTRVPCHLPFQTSFCRGQGKKRRLFGEAICPTPWYNIRHQQYQPNSALGPHRFILTTTEKKEKASGSSLKKKKGIIRYHSSYNLSVGNEEAAKRQTSNGDTHDKAAALDVTDDVEETKECPRKWLTTLRNLFRRKSSKSSVDKASATSSKSSSPETSRARDNAELSKDSDEDIEEDVKPQIDDRVLKAELARFLGTLWGTNDRTRMLQQASIEEKLCVPKREGTDVDTALKEEGTSQQDSSQDRDVKERVQADSNKIGIDTGQASTSQGTSGEKKKAATPESIKKSKSTDRVTIKEDSEEAFPILKPPELRSDTLIKASTSRQPCASMAQMSVNLKLGTSADRVRFSLTYVSDERECLELYHHDSFIGGACLCVHPSDNIYPDQRFIRLFHCDFKCDDTLIFCVVTKNLIEAPDQTLNVCLLVQTSVKLNLNVILIGHQVPGKHVLTEDSGRQSAPDMAYIYPLHEDEEGFQDLRSYLLLHQPSFYVPVDNCYQWEVRYYEMRAPGSRILGVNLRTSNADGAILLGHFGICPRTLNS